MAARKRKNGKLSARGRARTAAAGKKARKAKLSFDAIRKAMLTSLVNWGNLSSDCCDTVAEISGYLVELDAWVQNTDALIRANLPGGGDIPTPPKWPPA